MDLARLVAPSENHDKYEGGAAPAKSSRAPRGYRKSTNGGEPVGKRQRPLGKGDRMSSPLRTALLHAIEDAYRGPNGNYASIMDVVQEATAEQAAWKPAPDRNSIWQIVDHLRASRHWTAAVCRNLTAAPPPSPPWTEKGGNQADWEAEIRRLEDAHREMVETIAAISEADLQLKPIPGVDRTVSELLLNVVVGHDSYHAGQLRYLHLLAHSHTP
jgi:hypothetical protein